MKEGIHPMLGRNLRGERGVRHPRQHLLGRHFLTKPRGEHLARHALRGQQFPVDAAIGISNGGELRIGGGDKAAQTVFPPSSGRTWIVLPEDCDPAEIPPRVLVRIATRVAEASRRPVVPAVPVGDYERGDEQLDVSRWLNRRCVEVLRVDLSGDVRRWFVRCPGIASHTTADGVRDCVVTQEAGAGWGAAGMHLGWVAARGAPPPAET